MIKNSNKIYVLTNHHVVAISEKDDKCHSQATIYYDIYENGRFKYRKKVSATVLVASKHPDVALLLLDADISSIKKDGLTFCNRQVLVGTSVLQCGSFYGLMGSAAITDGIISYVPRFYDGDEYYGTTTVAPPGCSGGANYALDGTFIGMNSKSAGVGSNLIVPSYVIKTWLENRQYGFLIN
jgi:S1-C subfamily serine protease